MRTNRLVVALAVAAVVATAGCKSGRELPADDDLSRNNGQNGEQNGGEEAIQTIEMDRYVLLAAQSCEDVAKLWRQRAIEYMERQLDSFREAVLDPEFCHEKHYYDGAAVQDCSALEEPDDKGAKSYSTTNTQEVGVDEADFLKNDGKYIYILVGTQLQILDAWPAEEAKKISATAIEGTPRKLYVHKDVAVVYSSLGGDDGYDEHDGYGPPYTECTYGYDCDFTGDGLDSKVTVLDISDRKAPKAIRELYVEGSYLNSRRVEDFVYTMFYFADPPMPAGMTFYPPQYKKHVWDCDEERDDVGLDEGAVKADFEALRLANIALINSMPFSKWLPHAEDIWYVNGQAVGKGNPMNDCSGYYLSQSGDGFAMISLLSFDLTTQGPIENSTILSRPGAVYASKQSLYLAVRHQRQGMDYWFGEVEASEEASTIHQFMMAADKPKTAYVGSGIVKGRALNQFAMSQKDGRLRLATTSGYLPSPEVHNTISVLELKAGKLELVGQLDNLAPSEDIRSVRFSGDLAFMVTFKKVDPLFVIDLSDPTNPTVKGELKIPGYSTYMHFLDSQHILSIGFDAEDHGSFAYYQGILLQVFDVTDITKPSLLHKEIIGTRGTTSDAATNHLAFNFFKPLEALALPMVVCEESEEGGSYGDEMTFNGLMVYKVTVADGFNYLGGIPHAVAEFDPYDYDWYWGDNSWCSTWWSQPSSSTVKRSIFMEDYVYSIAPNQIIIAHISKLDEPIATIDL